MGGAGRSAQTIIKSSETHVKSQTEYVLGSLVTECCEGLRRSGKAFKEMTFRRRPKR